MKKTLIVLALIIGSFVASDALASVKFNGSNVESCAHPKKEGKRKKKKCCKSEAAASKPKSCTKEGTSCCKKKTTDADVAAPSK